MENSKREKLTASIPATRKSSTPVLRRRGGPG
jgi:hypothetical protein